MSVDLMHDEVETIPMTDSHSIEVGGDLDAAVAEESELPEPEAVASPELEPETPPATEPSPQDAATNLALAHLYDVQDRLDEAQRDHEAKAEVAKTAKKRVESLTEDLSQAVRKLRTAKTATEPDPERYPLLDRPKDEINAAFAKPEWIPPLPAATIEEHCRRRAVETSVDSIGLKAGIVKILHAASLHTVEDIGRFTREGGVLDSICNDEGSVTPRRFEELEAALSEVTSGFVKEWEDAHPEAEDDAEADAEPNEE